MRYLSDYVPGAELAIGNLDQHAAIRRKRGRITERHDAASRFKRKRGIARRAFDHVVQADSVRLPGWKLTGRFVAAAAG